MVSPYLLSLKYHLQLIPNFAAVFLNFYFSYFSLFWLMAVFGFYWATLWSRSLLDNLQALPLLLPWSARSTMSLLSQPGGSLHRRCRVRVFVLMYVLCVFMRGCLCLRVCSALTGLKGGALGCHAPCADTAAFGHHDGEFVQRVGLQIWHRVAQVGGVDHLGKKRAKAANKKSVCETAEPPNNPGNCLPAEKRIELCDFY